MQACFKLDLTLKIDPMKMLFMRMKHYSYMGIVACVLLFSCDRVVENDVAPAGSFTPDIPATFRMEAGINQPVSLQTMVSGLSLKQSATLNIGEPSVGRVVADTATNEYTYVPKVNYEGTDSIPFVVQEGTRVDSGVVIIEVKEITSSCPITATPDYINAIENTVLTSPIYINDGFCGNIRLTLLSSPGNGTASLDDDFNLVYTPRQNYVGADSLSYRLCNETGACSSARIVIDVLKAK
jgi:hypothetical protein